MNIEVKLSRGVKLPEYQSEGAAAIDLHACIDKPMTIWQTNKIKIPSGISVHIKDPGVVGVIVPRSGLGSKGLVLTNGTGIIDSDYQGEIMLTLKNSNDQGTQGEIVINPGDRVAQLLFMPVIHANMSLVEEFESVTERGTGGFGSTGVESGKEKDNWPDTVLQSLDKLRVELDEKGIKYDKRWGVDKLKAALEQYEAKNG